jgi:hypothetical protein
MDSHTWRGWHASMIMNYRLVGSVEVETSSLVIRPSVTVCRDIFVVVVISPV